MKRSTLAKGGALVVIFATALLIRVVSRYDDVLGGEYVQFGVNDSWYHMRLVENLVQHFPNMISFDPFTRFPHGQLCPWAPFFDLLLGTAVWIIGLGSPSQHTIEVAGAYSPAVLGALVTLPVFFIGRAIFNWKVGLLAAALIAIAPGEFLSRSTLGFADHHAAEAFLTTLAALFLILAVKSGRQRETSFAHLRDRKGSAIRRPLLYAILFGITLGAYLLTWNGGLLFGSIIVAYFIIQYIADHLKGKSTDYLSIIIVPSLVIPMLMLIPFYYPSSPGKSSVILALAVGLFACLLANGLSWAMNRGSLHKGFYPVALVGVGLVGILFVWIVAPHLLETAREMVFEQSAAHKTIIEAQPLLSTLGNFTWDAAWDNFTTGFYIAFVSLGLLVYAMVKEKSADERIFLIVWSIIMLSFTLGQRRFAYYYAVNVALLSGYFSWKILQWSTQIQEWAGFKEPQPAVSQKKGPASSKRRSKRGPKRSQRSESMNPQYSLVNYLIVIAAIALVFFGVFFPNGNMTKSFADQSTGISNEEWYSVLSWMRDNTPEPFDDTDYYYGEYPTQAAFSYPESAYGVISWWDYGHWITRMAHRIPVANPFGAGNRDAARFFIEDNVTIANQMMDDLGCLYVAIDYEMTLPQRKFWAMVTLGGESESDFWGTYYYETGSGLYDAVVLYYPRYYESMCPRLYNFGGEAVVPYESSLVISYQEQTDDEGNVYRVITDVANEGQAFTTYEAAQAFLEGQDPSANYILVSNDPFNSPVPLEELENYELVKQSTTAVGTRGDDSITYVQLFEYTP
jgi:dolichyl-diphosphooligosaccharide--protein glycosyltransferase